MSIGVTRNYIEISDVTSSYLWKKAGQIDPFNRKIYNRVLLGILGKDSPVCMELVFDCISVFFPGPRKKTISSSFVSKYRFAQGLGMF